MGEKTFEKRKADLEERLTNLTITNSYFNKAFGITYRAGEIDGFKLAIHRGEVMSGWDRTDLDDLEQKVLKLEAAKKEIDEQREKELPVLKRRESYEIIDHLLLEAVAEKELGKPEKMIEYSKMRDEIKKKYPKLKE